MGTALAERLYPKCEVVILDNLRRDAYSEISLSKEANIQFIEGDVTDRDTVEKACTGCQRVVHLAAVAGVTDVCSNPITTIRTSFLGTDNVLKACQANNNCKRIVVASTSEVYGPHADKVCEDQELVSGKLGRERLSYSVGKLAADCLAINLFKKHDLPVCVVRPFNVYGPGQVGEGAVRTFILRAIRSQPLVVHNQGQQVRAWCYIDDMIDGLLKVLFRQEAVGQVYNLGNPSEAYSILELAQIVVDVCGSDSPIEFEERNEPDVEIRIPDIEKAKILLGFDPCVDLKQGVRRTWEWYQKQEAEIERA